MNDKAPDILSVSAYLDQVNGMLEGARAKVLGEVSGVQTYEGRSYLYFSLRDEADGSTIKCFMWKTDYRLSGVKLEDGMQVVVLARPEIYKPNGGLSLQVEMVELVGEGALKLAYDKLRAKLEAEGLFDESRKRPLPDYPSKIGVITSKSGAVIHDFLSNIGKFGFEIPFVDSKVEGQDAIRDLLSAIGTLKKKDLDVLVIMRGGGSLESFLAFNNEALVRAVADFPAPVLTGIGHDKDAPLVSLASDKNVSTPTAVAALLNSTWNEARSTMELAEGKIFSEFHAGLRQAQFGIAESHAAIEKRFSSFLETFHRSEAALGSALQYIDSGIRREKEALSRHSLGLVRGFEADLQRLQDRLARSVKAIELSSPERQLARGYSIVRSKGRVVRKKSDVTAGEQLDIMVSDGTIRSEVL
jgi:exodeoxyribonuclease VII large subunit